MRTRIPTWWEDTRPTPRARRAIWPVGGRGWVGRFNINSRSPRRRGVVRRCVMGMVQRGQGVRREREVGQGQACKRPSLCPDWRRGTSLHGERVTGRMTTMARSSSLHCQPRQHKRCPLLRSNHGSVKPSSVKPLLPDSSLLVDPTLPHHHLSSPVSPLHPQGCATPTTSSNPSPAPPRPHLHLPQAEAQERSRAPSRRPLHAIVVSRASSIDGRPMREERMASRRLNIIREAGKRGGERSVVVRRVRRRRRRGARLLNDYRDGMFERDVEMRKCMHDPPIYPILLCPSNSHPSGIGPCFPSPFCESRRRGYVILSDSCKVRHRIDTLPSIPPCRHTTYS
ncbi:hypothetical protein BDZ90DRAFT_98441 [Jaminaea rosea]|uniref:Uncharacterized protein n=1 Tax=Jaminaea rosea TaxID=1569628 RepID=A0A316UH55_9BASI|nr:hypothetical protein BDZ90DRAFT_98441 [Jaminaea rosea]PWN24520.1 hypothetical protein BDZ90DRAFT_98441 [Jaminaea rosea]